MDIVLQYLAVVMAGLFSGIVSEIGGAGSLLSLPVLIGAGLPPVVANATNRMGVMALYTTAFVRYKKKNTIAWRIALLAAIPLIIGTIVGAWFASTIGNVWIDWLIVSASILVVVIDAYSPMPSAENTARRAQLHTPWHRTIGVIVLLMVGLYCGMVQSAMAYMMYWVLITKFGISEFDARGAKYFLSMAVTPVALIIFVLNGHLNYQFGLLLALGAAAGGWIGELMNRRYPSEELKKIYILALIVSVAYLILFMKDNIPKGIFEI